MGCRAAVGAQLDPAGEYAAPRDGVVRLLGSVLAYEIEAIADRLNAAVMAG